MKLVREEKEKKEKALKELDNKKDDEKLGDAHNLHEKKKHENHEHKYEDFMKEVTSENEKNKVAEAKPEREKPSHLKKLVKEIMATRREEAESKPAKKDEDKEDPTYPHTHMFEDYMTRLRRTEEKEGFGKNVDQSEKEGYQSSGTFQNFVDLTPAWGQ